MWVLCSAFEHVCFGRKLGGCKDGQSIIEIKVIEEGPRLSFFNQR